MGAIVLMQKSQRINLSFSVSPVSALTYVISKVVSLSIIGLVVTAVLCVSVGGKGLFFILLGTFLSSVLFTLVGLIIATKISSLNQFMIATVPFEIVAFVPALLHMFGVTPQFMKIYPPNVCMDLIKGTHFSWIGMMLTVVLIVLLLYIACSCVLHMWKMESGVKL